MQQAAVFSTRQHVQEALAELDAGGIHWMEHLNLNVGSKADAAAFFVDFLGFAFDASPSFHMNLGSQQLHLNERLPDTRHVFTGSLGLAVPSLDGVVQRIAAACSALAHTQFTAALVTDDSGAGAPCVAICCPWGSRYVVWEAKSPGGAEAARAADAAPAMARRHAGWDAGMGVRGVQPGIRYLELRCRVGTAGRIARFYEAIFGAITRVRPGGAGGSAVATVCVGPAVHLVFTEAAAGLSAEEEARQAGPPGGAGDGIHVCIYVGSFRGSYDRLKRAGLIWTNPRFRSLDTCDSWAEAASSRQFRFRQLRDLETGEPLLELEHECRAVRHGQYFKVLASRCAAPAAEAAQAAGGEPAAEGNPPWQSSGEAVSSGNEERAAPSVGPGAGLDDEVALKLLRELIPGLRSGDPHADSLSPVDKLELIMAEWSREVAASDGGALYTPVLSPHASGMDPEQRKCFFRQGRMPKILSMLSDAAPSEQAALFPTVRRLMSGAGRAALIDAYAADCSAEEERLREQVGGLMSEMATLNVGELGRGMEREWDGQREKERVQKEKEVDDRESGMLV